MLGGGSRLNVVFSSDLLLVLAILFSPFCCCCFVCVCVSVFEGEAIPNGG